MCEGGENEKMKLLRIFRMTFFFISPFFSCIYFYLLIKKVLGSTFIYFASRVYFCIFKDFFFLEISTLLTILAPYTYFETHSETLDRRKTIVTRDLASFFLISLGALFFQFMQPELERFISM